MAVIVEDQHAVFNQIWIEVNQRRSRRLVLVGVEMKQAGPLRNVGGAVSWTVPLRYSSVLAGAGQFHVPLPPSSKASPHPVTPLSLACRRTRRSRSFPLHHSPVQD